MRIRKSTVQHFCLVTPSPDGLSVSAKFEFEVPLQQFLRVVIRFLSIFSFFSDSIFLKGNES